MNFIHTLWTKPLLYGSKQGKELEKSIEITVFDYALSMRLVQLYGHTITLYTDIEGAFLLQCLPYNKVVILDLQDLDILFAAQIKFCALEQSNVNDYIIDGDILLCKLNVYDKLQQLLLNNDCIYSFTESFEDLNEAKQIFKPVIDIVSSVNLLPNYTALREQIKYPNTSVLFIKNVDLRNLYLQQHKYHKLLLLGNDFKGVWPDIWIEQYFLGLLLERESFNYSPIVPDYPNELEATRLGITHLGSLKYTLHPYVISNLYKIDNLLYNNLIEHIQKICIKYIN